MMWERYRTCTPIPPKGEQEDIFIMGLNVMYENVESEEYHYNSHVPVFAGFELCTVRDRGRYQRSTVCAGHDLRTDATALQQPDQCRKGNFRVCGDLVYRRPRVAAYC